MMYRLHVSSHILIGLNSLIVDPRVETFCSNLEVRNSAGIHYVYGPSTVRYQKIYVATFLIQICQIDMVFKLIVSGLREALKYCFEQRTEEAAS